MLQKHFDFTCRFNERYVCSSCISWQFHGDHSSPASVSLVLHSTAAARLPHDASEPQKHNWVSEDKRITFRQQWRACMRAACWCQGNKFMLKQIGRIPLHNYCFLNSKLLFMFSIQSVGRWVSYIRLVFIRTWKPNLTLTRNSYNVTRRWP